MASRQRRVTNSQTDVAKYQIDIGPFWAGFDLRSGRVDKSQLLYQLSYAGARPIVNSKPA